MSLERRGCGIHVVRAVTGGTGVTDVRFRSARRGGGRGARGAGGAGRRAGQVMARSVRKGRPWMARHTWAGVSGMSACRTPYGRSASMTALTTAGGDPTVADSPTPFAPIGWWGHGVTVSPSSHDGHSTDVGSR